ncbi:hypothetical protein ACE1B6_06780 [Aerosakkonemataceae cyanobacterium BLCC-F154]|uniref:Uncharacterized protein n=1 Tax=Floridaenema fluviatile BLCC-F154 TaxID=3153640 RepID=A0ABV4Y8X8_9CYAN
MSEPEYNLDSTVYPVSRKMSSIPKAGILLSDLPDYLDSLFQEIQAIKKRQDNLEKRQDNLEWTLANENANLKDENISLQQTGIYLPD